MKGFYVNVKMRDGATIYADSMTTHDGAVIFRADGNITYVYPLSDIHSTRQDQNYPSSPARPLTVL